MLVGRHLALALALYSATMAAKQNDCPFGGHRPGEYSQLSVDLCFQDPPNGRRKLRIESPDHSVVLEVNGDKGQFYKKGHPVADTFHIEPDVETVWSSDFKAFIITTVLGSEEPAIGGISFIDNRPDVPDDLMIRIQKDFATRHPNMPCANEPNVAGLAWRRGSREAVLVAEVQTIRCAPADGYFEAYVVSIPEGKIIERYSMKETIRQFKSVLGPGLLDDIELQKEEHKSK